MELLMGALLLAIVVVREAVMGIPPAHPEEQVAVSQ